MLLNENNSRLILCGELALLVAVIINSFSVVLMLYSGPASAPSAAFPLPSVKPFLSSHSVHGPTFSKACLSPA